MGIEASKHAVKALYCLQCVLKILLRLYNKGVRGKHPQTPSLNSTATTENAGIALDYLQRSLDPVNQLHSRLEQRQNSQADNKLRRLSAVMTIYKLKGTHERGRPNVRHGSVCREVAPMNRLRYQRDIEKEKLAELRENLEDDFMRLENDQAWGVIAERLLINDPTDPEAALAMARLNNPIAIQEQLDTIVEKAELLRREVKLVMGDNYHHNDSYGLNAPPVHRAKLFMRMLEDACREIYYADKAALKKVELLERRKDSVFDVDCTSGSCHA